MASHSSNPIMATPSNARTLDPTSDLGKDYATLKAIRNLADNATRRRAQTVVADRHHGADRDEPPRRKPRLPLAGLRLAPTMTDHEEHILYLMIELDQALARKTPRWAPEQMDAARRWLASLLERLLAIIPRS